jgi:hypothetical protein
MTKKQIIKTAINDIIANKEHVDDGDAKMLWGAMASLLKSRKPKEDKKR